MDKLSKPKTSNEMEEELKKLQATQVQIATQVQKNRNSIERVLTQAERTSDENERKTLVERVDRAMEFNKQYIRRLEETNNIINLTIKSLSEAPNLYKPETIPNHLPPKPKTGGKSKKHKKTIHKKHKKTIHKKHKKTIHKKAKKHKKTKKV